MSTIRKPILWSFSPPAEAFSHSAMAMDGGTSNSTPPLLQVRSPILAPEANTVETQSCGTKVPNPGRKSGVVQKTVTW